MTMEKNQKLDSLFEVLEYLNFISDYLDFVFEGEIDKSHLRSFISQIQREIEIYQKIERS